jgi:Cu-Zn family superoxide dismutase
MKDVKAVAVFSGDITGTVHFTECKNEGLECIEIKIRLKGFAPNTAHGFHVHEAGDLTDKCMSMCAHFNPYGTQHGGPSSKVRHVGDLGNVRANSKGEVSTTFYDDCIRLRGTKCNILGRGLILHENEDDLGVGDEESLRTGNAGKRIACAVIGYAKDYFK